MNLFTLDVVPPRCGVEAQLELNEQTGRGRARFRAIRLRRIRRSLRGPWSGWFDVDLADLPVVLRWDTLAPEAWTS